MNIRRIYAVALRYAFIVRGNPQRVFNIFVWAIMDIILWGFITKYLNQVGNAAFSFTTVLLGAVILWSFLIRAQQGLSTPALEDTWSRNLLNYFGSPLRTSEYILGLVLASVITSLIGLSLVLALAGMFFGLSIFGIGLMLVPFFLILFLFGLTLGIVAIAMMLRYGPSAEWLIWPIPALIEPFCGVLYPISVLPHWMQAVSHILPPSYVFEGMRAVLLTGQFASAPLLIGVALSALYLLLAYAFFAYVYRYAVRYGLITRFGAEGV